jgi:ABC-type amino acid transport substrate-binding protein
VALGAVAAGEADSAVVDALAAYEALAGAAGLALAGPPIEPEPYVMAVSLESPVLLRRLEETLAAMEADGTLRAMKVKWFGEASASE